jgi:cytochrome c biogenesis protein CcdA
MLSHCKQLLVGGFVMGWGPCLAYTAPLLLPFTGATKRSWQDGLKVGLVFSAGRLLALAILGGLATVAFSFINQFFPPHKSGWLYIIASLFMVILGSLVIVGKGFRLSIGNRILQRGTESMFLFGFLMGVAPCVPYVAILTYIACVAENAIVAGVVYAAVFAVGTAIAPIVLTSFMGIVPSALLKSPKLLRTFQVICGVVLVLFGLRLFYYVLNVVT